MKNFNKIYLYPLVLLMTITGCKKLLEPKIYDQINANQFPKTESDVNAALTTFYASFGTFYVDNYFNTPYLGYSWATSICTDEAHDLYNASYGSYVLGPATFSGDGSFYKKIRFVAQETGLISLLNNSSIPNKSVYIAETKCLRAWYMYILYDFYGPLNFKLDPATLASNVVDPRLTQAACVQAITSDLTDAIAGLPDKYNNDPNNWGRVSKGVARMILLKLYMHEKQWAQAESVAKDLTTMGYSLDPSYSDVFVTSKNSEVIYAVPGNGGTDDPWYKCILPYDAQSVLGLTVQAGYKLNEMPWAFYDTYAAGDKRLQTIANSYVNTAGKTIDRAGGLSGAIPMKYINFQPNEKGFDRVLYRYADVLLSIAECENELNNGPTGTAINDLKQITDRAGTTIPPTALAGHDAFSDFLLAERGRELYWEFDIRRQDLIRHGTLISNAVARGKAAQSFETIYPIPSDVIIASNGVIKQNPGY